LYPLKKREEGENRFERMSEVDEKIIRSLYNNGKLCGQIHDDIIIQNALTNPLRIDGKEFELTAYLLIASSNPLIAYT